ncbi:glycosyl transferase [Pedobacter yulinensis]|uniref:Glycosyl transferase n=1 Tax=Pedobacter yulinensis TaxID=2126353 RepID=A0A2T3HR04_9SPHI|nr:glycosyl transferase [Pedobacter yulinensis]PST84872.1 glycosyl transferase [Pedobacter yulinensis]
MKVSGFTFIRNAVVNDYPVREAISSVLPLCDEFVVALGNSSDDTEALVRSIDSDKIRIINTVWDESLKEGGAVFAAETNKALAAVDPQADWLVYIQGDEAIHENDIPLIRQEMENCLTDNKIEGLLFNYRHFYGSYDYTAESRRWYRREIRILKNLPGMHSYRDAQGFRRNGKKICTKLIHACIYHYGWVKPPKNLLNKVRNFNQYYHTQEWIEENYPEVGEFDMRNADRLVRFEGSHPAVMQERIARSNWKFREVPDTSRFQSMRRRLLEKFEAFTGIRPFEYRNYKRVR